MVLAAGGVQVVVYTSQLPTYADPILDRLDPHHACIAYRYPYFSPVPQRPHFLPPKLKIWSQP